MIPELILTLAFVLFVLASLPKVPQPFPFVPAGLALWVLSILIGVSWPRLAG